jgi:hypothetical protein
MDLENTIANFVLQLQFGETFPNFQDLITLLISEEMRVVGTSSNGGSQENAFYSNSSKGRGRGVKTSFRGRHEGSHGGHHQMKVNLMEVNLMEVDEETLQEEEVVVEVIKVSNQIATQIATIAGNLGTRQRIVIKRNMMHEMESCKKGIMHQLAIKVMSNCL